MITEMPTGDSKENGRDHRECQTEARRLPITYEMCLPFYTRSSPGLQEPSAPKVYESRKQIDVLPRCQSGTHAAFNIQCIVNAAVRELLQVPDINILTRPKQTGSTIG